VDGGGRFCFSETGQGLEEDLQGDLTDPRQAQMYTPFVQTPWPFLSAVVRTTTARLASGMPLRDWMTA